MHRSKQNVTNLSLKSTCSYGISRRKFWPIIPNNWEVVMSHSIPDYNLRYEEEDACLFVLFVKYLNFWICFP